MPEYQSPSVRYRELALEALELANTFPPGEQRESEALAGELDRVGKPRRHRAVGGLDPLPRRLGLEILRLAHDSRGGYPAGAAAARPRGYEVMAAAISSKLST